MADSDDEDTFASFGTPFEPEEEDAPRKKAVPIHEQIVTDSEGRRRFHGAFTGGFSAGYFNSVGTKEGWQPSTFVSSRSKKFDHRAQRPEDFMDDEDLGEFGIAPKRITTKEEFLSQEQEIKNRRKRIVASGDSEGIIPGEPVLQDLVLPVKMSVGVELLKKMGWKEGQGVGPRERRTKKKVYGCSLPPGLSSQTTADSNEEEDIFAVGLLFAPKDVDTFAFTPKDDKHGLGYRGLDPSTALFVREDWLGMDPVSSRAGKKGITGQAFGVGAFEEDDDDIYTVDHMSNYDMELTADRSSGLHGWTGPPKENTRGGALSIFTATPKAMDVMKTFPPPLVPRDFNCTHKFNNSASDSRTSTSEEGQQKRKTLTASDRGEILGEEPLPAPKKSVFDYMSKQDKERVLSSSKSITRKPSSVAPQPSANHSVAVSAQKDWSSKVWPGHSSFKPFAKDPAKQARYEEFLKGGKGEHASQQINESGLTEWEREREKEEFARSASLYRPLNSTMAARFTTAKHPDDHRTVYEDVPAQESSDSSEQTKAAIMKLFGKLTRDTFEWHPNNILCKRFNIPNPYPGSDFVGVPKIRRPKFTLGDFITPPTEAPRAITYEVLSTSSEGERKLDNIENSSKSVKAKVSETPSETATPETSDLTSSVSVGSSVKPTSIASSKCTEAEADVFSNEPEQTDPNQVQGDTNSAPKRPPMDLFKAIFADSSDDESNTSDGEGDEKPERLSIQTQMEDKAASGAASARDDVKTDATEATDRVHNDRKTLEEGPSSAKEREINKVPPEIESLSKISTEVESEQSPLDIFGPTLPPGLRHTKSSVSVGNSAVGTAHNDEELNRKRRIKRDKRKDTRKCYSESSDSESNGRSRNKELSRQFSSENYGGNRTDSDEALERKRRVRKDKRKDSKKRYSGPSDSEDDYRSKRRHKNKEKKHKHKSKHRGDKKEKSSEKKRVENKSDQSKETVAVFDDKQILSKLKNLQNLKAGKRMRASDFM